MWFSHFSRLYCESNYVKDIALQGWHVVLMWNIFFKRFYNGSVRGRLNEVLLILLKFLWLHADFFNLVFYLAVNAILICYCHWSGWWKWGIVKRWVILLFLKTIKVDVNWFIVLSVKRTVTKEFWQNRCMHLISVWSFLTAIQSICLNFNVMT